MSDPVSELRTLLTAAAASRADDRGEWRDPIAQHGDAAVRALDEWLDDRDLRAFALATILRAAELGAAPIAEAVLRKAQRRALAAAGSSELGDAADAVERLRGVGNPETPSPIRRLVRGRVYRRVGLHAAGLGGNRQTGISYPANGNHALLLTTIGGREHFGYNDRWEGDDELLYYGEWKGTPEMSLSGGNAAIIERSPNLYLFASEGKGFYRFEGAFEYLTHTTEWTKREGNPQRAIVFRLRRVSDTVEL